MNPKNYKLIGKDNIDPDFLRWLIGHVNADGSENINLHFIKEKFEEIETEKADKNSLTEYFNKTEDKITESMFEEDLQNNLETLLTGKISFEKLNEDLQNRITDYEERISEILTSNNDINYKINAINQSKEIIESNLEEINELCNSLKSITENSENEAKFVEVNNEISALQETVSRYDSAMNLVQESIEKLTGLENKIDAVTGSDYIKEEDLTEIKNEIETIKNNGTDVFTIESGKEGDILTISTTADGKTVGVGANFLLTGIRKPEIEEITEDDIKTDVNYIIFKKSILVNSSVYDSSPSMRRNSRTENTYSTEIEVPVQNYEPVPNIPEGEIIDIPEGYEIPDTPPNENSDTPSDENPNTPTDENSDTPSDENSDDSEEPSTEDPPQTEEDPTTGNENVDNPEGEPEAEPTTETKKVKYYELDINDQYFMNKFFYDTENEELFLIMFNNIIPINTKEKTSPIETISIDPYEEKTLEVELNTPYRIYTKRDGEDKYRDMNYLLSLTFLYKIDEENKKIIITVTNDSEDVTYNVMLIKYA